MVTISPVSVARGRASRRLVGLGGGCEGSPLAAPEATLGRVAHAYADFARDNPAVDDAMFTRSTRLPFAAAEPPEPLVAAFTELRHAVAALTPGPEVETRTEVLWAALHGLATLTRTNRLRPDGEAERLRHLVAAFHGG